VLSKFYVLKTSTRAPALAAKRFENTSPRGTGVYFGLDLPDLLLSILKDKKLFQFRMHERTRY
jgi:hypothetical protein